MALAPIPEAIAFSIIAGVDPKVGLYASFSIAVVSALQWGVWEISAATVATAVLMVVSQSTWLAIFASNNRFSWYFSDYCGLSSVRKLDEICLKVSFDWLR